MTKLGGRMFSEDARPRGVITMVGARDLRARHHMDAVDILAFAGVYTVIDFRGQKRFYPPGQHPATAAWREVIKRLRVFEPYPEASEALAYAEERVAEFEALHNRDIAEWLRARLDLAP